MMVPVLLLVAANDGLSLDIEAFERAGPPTTSRSSSR